MDVGSGLDLDSRDWQLDLSQPSGCPLATSFVDRSGLASVKI